MECSSPATRPKKIRRISKFEEHIDKFHDDEASRLRQDQEMEMFAELADLLPLPKSLSSQLDPASIMRLTIAFLKVKSLLSVHELFSTSNDDQCFMADSCWPQALGGMLLALTSEGDIIYLTDNVINQLGLTQVDLIGQSIYDYCHPCDHNKVRQVLALRPDGELARSICLRLKSTLTAEGTKNDNQKSTNYKAINCSGRIVPAKPSNVRINCPLEDDCELLTASNSQMEKTVNKSPTSHFLVMISDPIPSESDTEMPLDSHTFITNHTLDMKYTYVDEMIGQFLGYTPEDLIGRCVYEFHHPQDSGSILLSYNTAFNKGQAQTQPYRFMAKHGGYAWLQTQATMISEDNENIRSQAVLCVHTFLSEIEDANQILLLSQAESSAT